MDPITAVFMTFGVILILASWIELLFASFKDDYNWGLASLFAPPLSYVYALFSLEKAQGALGLAVLGWGLILLAII